MELYNRLFRVSVGEAGSLGPAFSDLRCTFDIKKSTDSKQNSIAFSVYNLGPSTRTKFETLGNRVLIEAGYAAGGLQTLAVGDIVRAVSSYEHPEIVTKVEAGDGDKALTSKRVSLSYKGGTAAKTMVQEIVDAFDIDQTDIPIDLSGAFKSAWSYVGRARDAMDQLAVRFGFEWSIQNNTLQITPKDKPSQRQAVVLSASSGLIGYPAPLDDMRGESDKSKKKEPPGIRVVSLLNPSIIPGDPIIVDSVLTGRATFKVKAVQHRGDTHAARWETEVECLETTSK